MPYPKYLLCSAAIVVSGSLTGCASLAAEFSNPLDRFKPDATQITAELPQPEKNNVVQNSWVEPAPSQLPTTDWIASFGSPQLDGFVAEALAQNTNVRAAAASWDAARASLISARSGLLPSVDYAVRGTHTEFANNDIGDRNSLTGNIGASWEADMWGRVRDGADSAELSALSSQADYAATRLSIAGQTVQSWLNLIESRLLLDLAEKNLETQNRALALTQRRFEGGIAGSVDVRLARSSVASAQATLASRKQSRAAFARSLEILLRRYPQNALTGASDLPVLPPLTGTELPGDVLARRPDLLTNERAMAAQGLQVDVARKNMLPRLTLGANADTSVNYFSDLFDIDQLFASIAAGLTGPIFNAGALQAEVDRNEANLKRLIEVYASSVLTAYLEVENALDAENRLLEREQALRVSLDEAQQAEARLRVRYSEGLATILELLDSQSRAITAESQLIGARKERLANRVRLHLALGGGEYGIAPQDTSFAELQTFDSAGDL